MVPMTILWVMEHTHACSCSMAVYMYVWRLETYYFASTRFFSFLNHTPFFNLLEKILLFLVTPAAN